MNASYKRYKELNPDSSIKFSEFKEVIKNIDSYQLMKPRYKVNSGRRIMSLYPFNQLQADVMFFEKHEEIKKKNKGVLNYLVIIDVFTKYLFVYPLKDLKSETISLHFKDALDKIKEFGYKVNLVETDGGSEFKKDFLQLMKDEGIKHFVSKSKHGASMAERVIRTIKNMISRSMINRNTYTFINHLQRIVDNYNSKKHSVIKMSPFEAINQENVSEAVTNFINYKKPEPVVQKFLEGDIVRLVKPVRLGSKEFDNTFSSEKYVVVDYSNGMYSIKPLEDYTSRRGKIQKVYSDDLVLSSL